MKNNIFELWIDESGDFIKDSTHSRLNPSLVGGILIKKGIIDECEARKILQKDYVHFNQEPAEYTIEVLKKVKELGGEFIIFENRERLNIIDSDTTYLNILSEGIAQLLTLLSVKYTNFKLEILIATRKNTVEDKGIIKTINYEKKLKERLILAVAKEMISKVNSSKYEIKFDDARTSKRLMLSDGVCNTYLTRTSSKFNEKQRQFIDDNYSDEYKFSVFQKKIEVVLNEYLTANNLGEALMEIYTNEESLERYDYYLNSILDRLESLHEIGQNIQLRIIISKIESYFKIDYNYTIVIPLLIKLQEKLIPSLKSRKISCKEFILDISLYLYAAYTHCGSALAEGQDKIFSEALNDIDDIFNKLSYYVAYKTRQAIHLKNMFDVEGAVETISNEIKVLEDLSELITMIDNVNNKMVGQRNIMLAKGYGTRLQGWSMLIHKDAKVIDNARQDYERAISHFTNDIDKERQHVYLCQAETEALNFDKALEVLLLTRKIKIDTPNYLDEFLKEIKEEELHKSIYIINSYLRIIAYNSQFGDGILADELVKALGRNQISIDSLKKQYKNIHPLQSIYWYMGMYLTNIGEVKNASRYYNLALEVIGENNKDITMMIIKIGILASRALMYISNNRLEDAKSLIKEIDHVYSNILNLQPRKSVINYIKELEENITDIFKYKNNLNKLARKIMCIN